MRARTVLGLITWLWFVSTAGCSISLSYSDEQTAPWFVADDLNDKRILLAPCPEALPAGWGLWPATGPASDGSEHARDRWVRDNLARHFAHEFHQALSATITVDPVTATEHAREQGLLLSPAAQDVPAAVRAWLPVARSLDCDYLAVVRLEELSRARSKVRTRKRNAVDGDYDDMTTYSSSLTMVAWLYVFRSSDGALAFRVRGRGKGTDSDSERQLELGELLVCLLIPPLLALNALLNSADYPDFYDPHDVLKALSEGILARLPQLR